MNIIELTNAEQDVLKQILQSSLTTLEVEISHSDHIEFRQQLKKRLDILEGLIRKVESGMTVEV